ncbi:hypothetical protein [Flavobacterium sp.]|uniref:hypothetical protein n=1 Tax=Flavobacterium sp. TaxID=239 RepID=UPI00286EF0C8|nr:hypothetical protein [Flavobacterium sp.]
MTQILKNTFVLLLALTIFSCSNDEEIGTIKSDPVISQLQNSLHLDKFTDQNISKNLEVNWNDVKKTTTNGIEIYEVGVIEKTPTTIESTIFQDKLKYEIIGVKNGNDISSYFIQAYSSLNHDLFPSTIKSLNNFTGTFKVFDLSGKPTDQLVVYDGKSINPSKNPDLNLLTTAINSFYISKNLTSKVPECNAYIAYYTEMWEATYRVWRMADSGKFITMTFVGEKYLGTKVTYMAIPYACDSPADAFHMLERHSLYITTLVADKIDASGLTGKAKCLNDLLNGNAYLQKLLINFEGTSEFNINIVSKDNVISSGNEVNGVTFPPINNTILIQISTSRTDSNSTLDAVRTILHEYIHADIWRKLLTTNKDDVAAADFKKLYELYGSQHGAMAALYLSSMKEALKDFHKNMLPDDYQGYINYYGEEPSDAFYEALAWRGLEYENVKDWTNLPQTEKERISNLGKRVENFSRNAPCK